MQVFIFNLVMDEESASQSSSAGFNDNLSKKSRIEEIRASLLKNVSDYYTLKWIRTIFVFMILMTILFSGCYLLIYNLMHDSITDLTDLNVGYFETTIWLGNLVSSLISMRSIFNLTLKRDTVLFNNYEGDINTYFETMRAFSKIWYTDILINFGSIEQTMSKYYTQHTVHPLWQINNITYPYINNFSDQQSFPLGLSQSLSASNKLIASDVFSWKTARSNIVDTEEIERISYAGFISIENTINNVIPYQVEMLNLITSDFENLNMDNMIYALIIIISYGIVMIVLSILYLTFLYITNKSMQKGFEMASHIKLDMINETIMKIENFNNNILTKFTHKNKYQEDSGELDINDFKTQNPQSHNTDKYRFNNEPKKYRNLNILSFSYLQVILLIIMITVLLIPLYIVTYQMIYYSNQMLLVQTYIFGKLVLTSHSVVNIKCLISNCQTDTLIVYPDNSFLNKTQYEDIIISFSYFPTLSNFYNNKFLIDACLVIYPADDPNYEICKSDSLIKSANNTDSLLKLLDETVAIIEKDRLTRTQNNSTFQNEYLFETNSFNELEKIFYKYITPISNKFSIEVIDSLQNFLGNMKAVITLIVVICVIMIMIFSFNIIFIFINKLVHLISVSRCILKILPTSVITATNELESWIESNY
jgi:hypothetical protein